MYLIAIAWIYVALMMAVAEATNSNGTVLGAVVTFVLYGAAPVALVMYLLTAPARSKAIKAKEQAAWQAAQQAKKSGAAPDGSGHAPAAPQPASVAPVGKEP